MIIQCSKHGGTLYNDSHFRLNDKSIVISVTEDLDVMNM